MIGNLAWRVPKDNASRNYAQGTSKFQGEEDAAFKGMFPALVKSSLPLQDDGFAGSSKGMVMHFETSDGKKGDLYWDKEMLVSVGGSGGTTHAKYHESSTKEDPVAIIWGTDAEWEEYEKIVHLNTIDPHRATPAELMALNAHLAKISSKPAEGLKNPGVFSGSHAESPIALWLSAGNGVNTKMDMEQYLKNYASMQQQSGNVSGAEFYQFQLERFLFFYQQNKGNEDTWNIA